MAAQRLRYGQWTIEFDPPPVFAPESNWAFSHDDFDASWEGEEDGYVSNGLDGRASSIEDAKAQIAEIEDDKGMPSTAQAKADATLLAVSTYARCASKNDHVLGCSCREIAGRLIAKALQAEAA